jgi:hypothetical protein
MTVAELMAWLSTQDQSAGVFIHDADTGLFLKLKTGMRGDSLEKAEDAPENSICVHGDYHQT